jgi:hypothetical protein
MATIEPLYTIVTATAIATESEIIPIKTVIENEESRNVSDRVIQDLERIGIATAIRTLIHDVMDM